MALLPDTEAILRLVEEATAIPVEVISEPSLTVLARITMARRGLPAHIVQIQPSDKAPDYLIAYECGFILRLYASPPDQRCEFAGTSVATQTVLKQLRAPDGVAQRMRLSEAALSGYTEQLCASLLTQLRSYPVGMRIDRWIHDDYPSLRHLQAAAIDQQQRTNAQVLAPRYKAIAPAPVYEANLAMNAAYAMFCDELLGSTSYSVAFRSTRLGRRGTRLLSVWKEFPDEPRNDRALVNAWADELGLTGWYEWVPVRA